MEEPTHFSLQSGTGSEVFQGDASPLRPSPGIHSPLEERNTLPGRYGMDRLQLMVQSPFRVFAYWEVTSERLQKALAPFPQEEHNSFRMILKWIEHGQGQYQAYDSGAASEWWFETRPGCRYRAELCLHSEEFGAIPVIGSNEVETPSHSMAEAAVEIEESRETAELLSKLVDLTGLKEAAKQGEKTTPIIEVGGQTGKQLHSERKEELKSEAVSASTKRPTSFSW